MRCYSEYPVNDDIMTKSAGAQCYGFSTGQSHEELIQRAGGEIGYDGFRDPRPGFDGPIYADKIFINQHTNVVQGINFYTKDGKFCCSYMGTSYQDIKESNKFDLNHKQKQQNNNEYDEYGVKRSVDSPSTINYKNQNEIKR